MSEWVLVKSRRDTGAAEAAYGPVSEQDADWLLGAFADGSMWRWDKVPLQNGPGGS